jgi:hypothetical protein
MGSSSSSTVVTPNRADMEDSKATDSSRAGTTHPLRRWVAAMNCGCTRTVADFCNSNRTSSRVVRLRRFLALSSLCPRLPSDILS